MERNRNNSNKSWFYQAFKKLRIEGVVMDRKKCHIVPIAICLLCVVILFSSCGLKQVPDSPLNPPDPHNPTEPHEPTKIQGLEASILERKDGIELRWTSHAEADRYRIYRSTSRIETWEGIGETKDIQFYDIKSEENQLKEETPYYYWVTWVNADEAEFGQDIIPVMGVFSSQVEDELEPNNRLENPTKLVKGKEYDAFICAFTDAEGEIAIDEDWYVFERTDCTVEETLKVDISILDNFSFINHLKLWFYHKDGTIDGEEGNIIRFPSSRCLYSFPSDVSKVYFRIAPFGISENIGIGSYKIQLPSE